VQHQHTSAASVFEDDTLQQTLYDPPSIISTTMSDPPKNDKITAMAARQQKPANTASNPPSATARTQTVQPAPKRDKFAALSSHQQQTTSSTKPAPAAAVSAPAVSQANTAAKRDKFAALAATQHQPAQPTVTPSAPKRDKFAALAAPKRDKFAAVSAASPAATVNTTLSSTEASNYQSTAVTTANTVIKEPLSSDKKAMLLKRIQQRESVWKDLDKAEATVIRLLRISRETAHVLSLVHPTDDSTKNRATQLARDYREAVASLHDSLQPHAHLVQAYKAPTRPHRLYPARVQTRLVQEKRALLQDWHDLEREELGLEAVVKKEEDVEAEVLVIEMADEKINRESDEMQEVIVID
jgi:hypothetical protein